MSTITYKEQTYRVELRPALSIGGAAAPWCIEVDGGWYQLTFDAVDVDDEARRYCLYTLKNPGLPVPIFRASRRYPLLLRIDDVAVRAWPQYLARGTGAKTFVHPTVNRRVGTERGPVWIFEAADRPASEGGMATTEQTLVDVASLAKRWVTDAG